MNKKLHNIWKIHRNKYYRKVNTNKTVKNIWNKSMIRILKNKTWNKDEVYKTKHEIKTRYIKLNMK